jgi:large subunit GTPase 1
VAASIAFADVDGNIPQKAVVGLVGYPNVGKSSTINALLGEKRVSVSSTPGKTKHFQTIHLSPSVVLCDCPGLVFPQFATSRAELVCDGILPIDQMREYIGPTTLVVNRIPKTVLEMVYGLSMEHNGIQDDGDHVSAEALLVAYASELVFVSFDIPNCVSQSGEVSRDPDWATRTRHVLHDTS